jgi:hypothetical protein
MSDYMVKPLNASTWDAFARPAGPQSRTATRFPGLPRGVRAERWTLGGRRGQKPSRPALQKGLISRNFSEPSDGLEPSTPSLPSP